MKKFVIDAMQSVGTDQTHAAQLADALILADKRGHYRLFFNFFKKLPLF